MLVQPFKMNSQKFPADFHIQGYDDKSRTVPAIRFADRTVGTIDYLDETERKPKERGADALILPTEFSARLLSKQISRLTLY